MIEARSLRRAFVGEGAAKVEVLGGVDLKVEAGEFVAVRGRSGSGKSTLLHVLSGLDADFSGDVTVAGVSLKGQGDEGLSQFRNERVGVVFQSFHLLPGLNAWQNVALPSYFAKAEVADAQGLAKEALARVGLADKAARRPSELSGGERQRVAVARALFRKPQVLFADEPTGSLDAQTGLEIVAVLKGLHAEGLTLFVVTHEDRVSSAAGRVLTLERGVLA